MQIAKYDFAAKAADLKAKSIALNTEYSDTRRIIWLVENALHNAFSSLAGAANKLEKAPQGCADFGNLIITVAEEIASIEALLSKVDLERVRTDAVYAGSLLGRAKTARSSAAAVDKLAASIAILIANSNELANARTNREQFLATAKKRYAVVKGTFTHGRGGGPVRFYTGEHCDIDFEDGNGDKRIAGDNGNTSVFFAADEVARLFDIVEA